METTMTPVVTQPAQVKSILERSVVMVLRCGYVGNHRRVDLEAMEMQKDGSPLQQGEKAEIGASWRLFSSADLRPCNKTIGALKNQLGAMSCDGGIRLFGDGAYLLPQLNAKKADEACLAAQAQLAENVEKLVTQLEDVKARRKAKLGPLYKEAAYPTADEIRAAYKVRWSWVSFGAPENLVEVDAAVAARAEQDWNARMADAYAEVVTGLRASARLVMRELAERLRPDADGNPKVLRPTALRDLQDLLAQLPVLNSVGQDEKLADALVRIGGLSKGLNVDVLRENEAIRTILLETAEKTAASLDALISSGDVRAITFD